MQERFTPTPLRRARDPRPPWNCPSTGRSGIVRWQMCCPIEACASQCAPVVFVCATRQSMADPETFSLLLSRGEEAASAIGAPESKPLTWRALRDLAARTIDALNAMGIGRGDRAAIVLRNGPEMATAFVCVAAGAATAPLNPGYREDEFDFYL